MVKAGITIDRQRARPRRNFFALFALCIFAV